MTRNRWMLVLTSGVMWAVGVVLTACGAGSAPLVPTSGSDSVGDASAVDSAAGDATLIGDMAASLDVLSDGDGGSCDRHVNVDDPVAFEPVGVYAIGEGARSQTIEIPIPPDARRILIRVSVGERSNLYPDIGYQLEEVVARFSETGEEEQWVGPTEPQDELRTTCVDCRQRVAVSRAYGLFSFPNDGSTLGAADGRVVDRLRLRVALRDCLLSLPADLVAGTEYGPIAPPSVQVEVATLGAPPSEVWATLPLHLAAVGGEVGVEALETLVAEAGRLLEPAHIELVIVGRSRLDERVVGDVEFTPADQRALDDITRTALCARADTTPAVELMLVPCLIERNPVLGWVHSLKGYTTHIPGGAPVAGLADGVFLSAGLCPSTEGSRATDVVLAHELGHYLGLYHTVESDGREDHLDDTDEGTSNLMYYGSCACGAQKTLSEKQITVMRSHPILSYDVGDE